MKHPRLAQLRGVRLLALIVVSARRSVYNRRSRLQPVAVSGIPKRNQWRLRAGPANGHGARATPKDESGGRRGRSPPRPSPNRGGRIGARSRRDFHGKASPVAGTVTKAGVAFVHPAREKDGPILPRGHGALDGTKPLRQRGCPARIRRAPPPPRPPGAGSW
jgi:hypothetical protein